MAKEKGSEIEITTSDQETFPPWSELPQELLQIISSKVINIVDYVQFRSVCTSWRSNARPSNLRPQLPHLVLSNNPNSDTLSFFEFSDYRISTSEFPETHNKIILESSFGWLVLVDANESTLSLWNPFTRAQIQLPPPSDFPNYLGTNFPHRIDHRLNDGNEVGYDFIRKGYPWKFSLSTHPSNGCCFVFVTFNYAAEYAFCIVGDEYWTVVDTGSPWPLLSVIYHEEKFYAFDSYAGCWALDLSECKKSWIASPDDSFIADFHVVKTDEELLAVFSYTNFNENEGMDFCYRNFYENEGRSARVFKLDSAGEDIDKWVEIDSIGDYAIFLSGNNSTVAWAVDFPECRDGCIYFSYPYATREESDVYYIDVYDMKEKKFHFAPGKAILREKPHGLHQACTRRSGYVYLNLLI